MICVVCFLRWFKYALKGQKPPAQGVWGRLFFLIVRIKLFFLIVRIKLFFLIVRIKLFF